MKKRKIKLQNARDFLLENPQLSISKVSKLYGVDHTSLSRALADKTIYNIDGRDGFLYYFPEEEMQAIKYFSDHPNSSIKEVLKKYPVATQDTLKRWIRVVYGSYERHYRYNNNRNAFSTIKSEEDAYWLGFITADGYVCETQPKVILGLGEIDYVHLQKYSRYLGYSEEEFQSLVHKGTGGAYTKDNIVYSLITCGQQIVNNLVDKGVRQAKSGKEIPFICETKELQIAYIRGLFDGDGYIRSTQYGVGLVGSLDMLTFVSNFLKEELGWKDEKTHIYKHGKIYKYAIQGRIKSSQILQLLYGNATIYLDRKYNLYKTYIAV